jgi:hypothetical protein
LVPLVTSWKIWVWLGPTNGVHREIDIADWKLVELSGLLIGKCLNGSP